MTTNFVIPDHHIALTTSNHIQTICKPLEKLKVTYFSFVRSYLDASHIRLSNNSAWTKHYYERGFYNVVLKQVPDSDGSLLWSNIDKYPLFYEASEFYDVDNGMVLIVNNDDVTERYFFGSTKINYSMNYVYMHNLDLFKKFIHYFKENARVLIEKSEKNKIVIPNQHESNENLSNDVMLNEFLDDIRINKVCVRAKGKDYYISSSEAKILTLMKNGHSAKEISTEIGLTKKTIEIYRDKLKTKLNLYSRGNLIACAKRNTLLDINLL